MSAVSSVVQTDPVLGTPISDAEFDALATAALPEIARNAAVERCRIVAADAFPNGRPTPEQIADDTAGERILAAAARHGWTEADLLDTLDAAVAAEPLSETEADAASRELVGLIEEFDRLVDAYYAGKDGGRTLLPPARTIKGKAGLGKTKKVLEALCGILDRLRQKAAETNQSILYLVPTLALAEDIARVYRQWSDKVHVIRGRNEDTCFRKDDVDKVAKAGLRVRPTLCKAAEHQCPFWGRCGWSQSETVIRAREPGMLFVASHEYVRFAVEGLREADLRFQVIDESFWQSMLRHQGFRVAAEQKVRFRHPHRPGPSGCAVVAVRPGPPARAG